MNSGRKMTPKGQMSMSNSGPAIMMMPPHIRATFMPDPPLKHLPPPKRKGKKLYPDELETITTNVKTEPDTETKTVKKRNKRCVTGVANYMIHFERSEPPTRKVNSTPASMKAIRAKKQASKKKEELAPIIERYRTEQKESSGEVNGMNCYNTLFVGRLAHEVTERKLLRELEAFGPIKDLKLVMDSKTGKSRGYAFIEYEHEEDMKRAYRAADGMRVEGREIVVDVERGHTVPNWLPRRLGGGLGGTRLGGKEQNITTPGRFDPSKPRMPPPMPGGPGGGGMYGGPGPGPGGPMGMGGGFHDGPPGRRDGPPHGYGGGGYNDRGPPPGYGGRGGGGRGFGGYDGGGRGGYDRGPPPGYRNNYGGRGYMDRGMDRGMKRHRDRSPDRRDSRRPRW